MVSLKRLRQMRMLRQAPDSDAIETFTQEAVKAEAEATVAGLSAAVVAAPSRRLLLHARKVMGLLLSTPAMVLLASLLLSIAVVFLAH